MAITNLRNTLRANLPRATSQITMFIPSLDRDGRPIDQARWAREALHLLGRLFRGATAFPPGRGVWRDDERGGQLLEEFTVIVVSYTNPADHTSENLQDLAGFLHRFGREAHQGEVGIVIDDEYHGISRYEPEQATRQPKRRRAS